MNSPSFERIDYQLRYNKHIERKLIFRRLLEASEKINFSKFKYLGFGSIWFVDYKIAHKLLGISEMLSMERSDSADRARFNAPFGCIKVEAGDSGKIISSLNEEFWSEPTMCWLDYDGCLDPSVVEDMGTLLDKAKIGSVIAISVNGSFQNYRPRNINGNRSREKTALGQIEAMLSGIAIPQRFDERRVNRAGNHEDIAAEVFPEFLSSLILLWMTHRVQKAKRQSKPGKLFYTDTSEETELATLEFMPIYNFCHKDGVEMITVGGMLIDAKKRDKYKSLFSDSLEWSTEEIGLPAHERLDLIPITVPEKGILDKCLPKPKDEFITSAIENGIRVPNDNLEKYWKYYKDFPTFLEANH